MANPNTAWRASVSIDDVNRFLTEILRDNMYSSTYVSSGVYGNVFRIDVDMRVAAEYPFPTFYIDDRRIVYTSDSRDALPPPPDHHIHRFCCKIMPIYEQTDKVSFTNECMKQQDIYAKTNENLNAVCLPLFFYSTVAATEDSTLMTFIQRIMLTMAPFENDSEMIGIGISFMPYSANSFELPDDPSSGRSARDLLDSDLVLGEILKPINAISDENSVINLLLTNKHIYSYVVIVSLLIRLYLAGYCHGDLHLGNIIVYNWKSGMTINTTTNEPIYFYPAFSLIDTGFAFRHGRLPHHPLALRKYKIFESIIMGIQTIRSPKSRHNMISWRAYHWFPKILMNNVGNKSVSLDEDRCRFIHTLFCAFERYRINFENQRISILTKLEPPQTHQEVLLNIRNQNLIRSGSADKYIKERISQFNSLGGLRRNYYISNRKQTNRKQTNRMKTKITKKHTTHSVRRRRKSQHPRQRHSKSKYY